MNILLRLIPLLLCASLATGTLQAQVGRAFTSRYTLNARGAIRLVSNSIIQPKRGGSNTVGVPLTGYAPTGTGTADNIKNDKYMGSNIDVDADAATLNSSSANFTLPPCGAVAFAGLYWGAGIAINQSGDGGTSNGANPMTVGNWNVVKLKVPGATGYATVTASKTDTITTVFHAYQSFADVTALVQQGAGTGTYTIANVACDTNKWNTFGGWTLAIVYRDSSLRMQNLTVFDGVAVVGTGAATIQEITVTGFQAPPTGQINALLGAVVYDGDHGAKDGFEFKNNNTASTFIDLTTNATASGTSPAQDAWNSTITYTGSEVTTRNPYYSNTFGYDADMFTLANPANAYLRNNDDSATIKISSSSETYVLGLLTTQLDNFFPELVLETRNVRASDSLWLGDTVRFTSVVRNIGSDTATNVVFTDKLTTALKYVPGSITLNGVAITDGAGNDQGEYSAAASQLTIRIGTGANATTGGTIGSNKVDSTVISYKVSVTTTCAEIGTSPKLLSHQSGIQYRGLSLSIPDSSQSRPQSSNGCIGPVSPDPLYLRAGCQASIPLSVKLIDFKLRQLQAGNELCWSAAGDAGAAYTLYAGHTMQDLSPVYATTGSGDAVSAYCHTDTATTPGANYYRLRVRAANGAVTYSHVVLSGQSAGTGAIVPACYPNPASGTFSIALPSGIAAAAVEVLSVDGRVIHRYSNGAGVLDCSFLVPGAYVLRCHDTAGQTYFTRLMKQ